MYLFTLLYFTLLIKSTHWFLNAARFLHHSLGIWNLSSVGQTLSVLNCVTNQKGGESGKKNCESGNADVRLGLDITGSKASAATS